MANIYEARVAEPNEYSGHRLPTADKIVPPKWAWFAKFCWPRKTAAHLAAIGGKDERTARRWLRGKFEPPQKVMLAIINKLFERGQ